MARYFSHAVRLCRRICYVEVTYSRQMAKVRVVAGMKFSEKVLTNSQIAELLAIAAEDEPAPLDPAYRRAFRKALIWPVEFIPCGPPVPIRTRPCRSEQSRKRDRALNGRRSQ